MTEKPGRHVRPIDVEHDELMAKAEADHHKRTDPRAALARVRAVADAIDGETRTEPDTQRAAMQQEAVVRIRAALGGHPLHGGQQPAVVQPLADQTGPRPTWPTALREAARLVGEYTGNTIDANAQMLIRIAHGAPRPDDPVPAYTAPPVGRDLRDRITEPELTPEAARDLVDELGIDLYRAQDALAFVEECCVIADREGRAITTANVREWLKGARCGRQLLADRTDAVLREAADAVAADAGHIAYGSAADYAERHAALLRRMADEAQQDAAERTPEPT